MLLLTGLLLAQTGTNAVPVGEKPTFQATSQLVIETVVVKDKAGNPITGLTAKDFILTEDGVPQDIKFFEYQKLDEALLQSDIPAAQRVAPLARLTRGQISPETPGDVRYRDKRLLALYFDLTAMPPADQLRAFNAAKKFLKSQMTTADLVAIMAFTSGSVQVLQDFTADRGKLLAVVETLIVGEDENAPGTDAASSDSGSAFGQNDSEFNIFFTDRQLAALQTAATMLGRLNEKKALIYFASGLRLNGTNNQAQLTATINAAIRSGVAFWPVDARGLVAEAPLGDATRGSPGGVAMYTGAAANAITANRQRSQDTLWTLGADTGGKALLDFNDLGQGIVQAQKATGSYYILGYYTTNTNPDGKFRKIKITLANSRTDITMDYRQGYYANKVFGKFTTADKERQLEDALMLGDPVTDLTIAMEIGYFQLNSAEYYVPVVMKIPGSELALARRGGAERTVIDFIGEIKDSYGTTVSNVRDKVDIKLTGTSAAELARRPIEYDTGFTLLPGKYKIKVLARDAETGRMGTYEMKFTIPNLVKIAPERVPISSVVLSSQRVPMRDAVFNAQKDKQQLVNPLVQDGQKLIPSVTRVFSRSKDMYVFLQAYMPNSLNPLFAFVTFYRDGDKVFETKPLGIGEGLTNKLRTMPMQFAFSLDKLNAGEYLCQITVVDPKGERSAFWQAPVMLIQ
jgi:VWFA-related protein